MIVSRSDRLEDGWWFRVGRALEIDDTEKLTALGANIVVRGREETYRLP
jgi:hypothetical protein